MSKTKDEFLTFICDSVTKLAEENLPEGMVLDEYDINIRFVKKNNPLGDHLRLMGQALFVRLDTIKYDTPPAGPGSKQFGKLDKFLGEDILWINVEHITSVYPGKDMEIEGVLTKTCFVSIMEESAFRVRGSCESFFSSINDPLSEYANSASPNVLANTSHADHNHEDDADFDEEETVEKLYNDL